MEHERKYFQINTKDIIVDPYSQRDVCNRQKQFKAIMRNFNPDLVSPIKVACYDGKFICYDGLMTMKVLKARNNDEDLPVDCMVVYVSNANEVAELFLSQNPNVWKKEKDNGT